MATKDRQAVDGLVALVLLMVIAVLERRAEIGIRRALGASRRHIRAQFLTRASLLAGLGGIVGAAAGTLATLLTAALQKIANCMR